MSEPVRIRVSFGASTLELEGSPEWVAQYDADVKKMLDRLSDVPQALGVTPIAPASQPGTSSTSPDTGTDFGELLHSLPKGASATDQILLAGWFAQQRKADSAFATRDANALLLEHGVKVGNASQSMTNNLKAKRVFKTAGGYRVSKTGIDHLEELTGR